MLSSLGEWASGLNWIDVVLLLGLAAGLMVGVGVGFYRQVAIFTALLVGLFAAAWLATPLAASESFAPIRDALSLDADGARVASFAIVLWISLVLGLLACLIFHSFFSRHLRFIDGILGGAMGVAISSLFFGLLILGVFHSDMKRLDDPIRESQLGSRLAQGAGFVAKLFPDDIQERFEEAL